jgi:small subunit ribosomal protein S12
MSVRHWIKNVRARLPRKPRSPALRQCPHKKAVVIKCFDTTPRKPNSARRKTAKVRLSNRIYVRIYLEGWGLNRLQPHSTVLVRGRGPRDLPGVRYHGVRGQYDLPALLNYRRARSKYGVKNPVKRTPLTPLAEIPPYARALVSKMRYRFLAFNHLAGFKKFKVWRRNFWLLKSRLPQ